MRVGYIYKITSPTKRVYIGQTLNHKSRFSNYKNLHCKKQPKLYRSIIKYGWSRHKFEVIHECNVSELNRMERYYQDLFSACGKNGLNCTLTATNLLRQEMTEEVKAKIGAGSKKQWEKEKSLGIKRYGSPELRERLSTINREKMERRLASGGGKLIISEETRQNHSRAAIQRERNKEDKTHINTLSRKYWAGSHHTEQARRTIGDALRGRKSVLNGRKKSEGYGQFISDRMKEKSSWVVILLNTETGIYYYGVAEAAASFSKMNRNTLSGMINGHSRNKTSFIKT